MLENKRNTLIIVISVCIGMVAGVILSISSVRANFIQDFFTKVVPGIGVPEKSISALSENQVRPYEPLRDSYEEQVMKAVERASPAVVSIIVSKDVPVIEECLIDPFSDLPPEIRDFFGDGLFELRSECRSGTRHEDIGGGTGFIIGSDGLILTNKHVVSDEKAEYTVFTNEGKKFTARVTARDPVFDIALLRIDALDLPTVVLGDSDGLRLGQAAIAIGNALSQFRNTVSVGVISGLLRNIEAGGRSGVESIQGVIQTDAAINPGNSGGPLLNLKGEVIGINTAIVSGAQNIGFAIPVNQAKRGIESVRRTGDIKVSYLGVRYRMVTKEFAAAEKLPVDYGALIRANSDGPAVINDSPASRGGIRAEDIILGVNGVRVDENNPLGMLIQRYNIDDELRLTIMRNKREVELTVKLVERSS